MLAEDQGRQTLLVQPPNGAGQSASPVQVFVHSME